MFPVDVDSARNLLNAVVTAISVLGGAMAYASGYCAIRAMSENQRPDVLARRVNEALGRGFDFGWPVGIVALIISAWK